MKLNTQAFPYPVLTNEDGPGADYNDSAFQCSLTFASSVNDDNSIKIEYYFMLSNDAIEALLNNESASYAVEISCTDTLKREIKFLDEQGVLEVDASDLYGKVDFTPMIVIRSKVVEYESADLNEEYGDATFSLQFGDIIAVDETCTKYIEFNNLSFDSLIKVVTDDKLMPFEYRVETSPNIIFVYMGESMRAVWSHMTQDKSLKPALAMSVYKDVIYLAIEDLIMNEDSDSYRWARSLKSSIEEFSLQLPPERDFNHINQLAQRLIQHIGVKRIYAKIK